MERKGPGSESLNREPFRFKNNLFIFHVHIYEIYVNDFHKFRHRKWVRRAGVGGEGQEGRCFSGFTLIFGRFLSLRAPETSRVSSKETSRVRDRVEHPIEMVSWLFAHGFISSL